LCSFPGVVSLWIIVPEDNEAVNTFRELVKLCFEGANLMKLNRFDAKYLPGSNKIDGHFLNPNPAKNG